MREFKNKKWRRRGLLVLVLCFTLFVQGCAKQGSNEENKETHGDDSGKLRVVTTIFPPYDFVREIAGDQVELKMLLKPGEESHSYEPTPQDIIAIEQSDLFIYVGGENDVWVEDLLSSMPDESRKVIRLVDCVETVEEEHVEGMKESRGHEHEEQESHVAEENHSVHEMDEHVWTSPLNAGKITEAIKDALVEEDEKHRELYEERAKNYEQKLLDLDREFRQITGQSQRKVLVFGDRFPFRYFAMEYGLEYYAAFPGCAGDTEPSAATMAFLIEKVKEERIPVVLKMELSNENIANAVAEAAGAEVCVFYSCHNLSAEDFENGETYLSMMWKNTETLKEVLNGCL